MKNDPAPMEGSKLFNVLYGSQFKFDKEAMPAEIDALKEKIMKEYEEGEKPERRKRILLTGCPSSGAPMKVVKAIEENGGNVVVYENCGGAKSVDRLIDEDAEDIYQAIAERYLAIGCSVMTPDTNRYEYKEVLFLLHASRCSLPQCYMYDRPEGSSQQLLLPDTRQAIFPTIHNDSCLES